MARSARFRTARSGGKTPPDFDPGAFETLLSGDGGTLFLGLGPDPERLRAFIRPDRPDRPVFWLEHPDVLARMDERTPAWRDALPERRTRVTPEEILGESPRVPHDAAVIFYRPNMRLFPEFWGPLRAAITARRIIGGGRAARTRGVLLPGDSRSLLTLELEAAFDAEGFHVMRVETARMLSALPALLEEALPALCFSVNLRGLDPAGDNFRLLRALGVPTAIWMVDNPWHILSALREGWWREAHICATDASFLPALRAAGAREVFHLPPAAWMRPSPFPRKEAEAALHPLLFVGRSRFPGKKSFFAAGRVPEELSARALSLLDAEEGERPDFHWWMKELRIERPWPGTKARLAGLGAEETSLARRVRLLEAALPHGLTIYGDEDWRALLPGLRDLRAPADYYTELPRLYGAARYSLNVTSLLLPSALTQRHFDVWSAGGFLITDDTPGLGIFPPELRRETSLRRPSELDALLGRLENDPSLYRNLRTAWQKLLAEKHGYRHRVRRVCERLGIDG
jgi:hypothetical protein